MELFYLSNNNAQNDTFLRCIALERIFLYTYLVPGDNIGQHTYTNRADADMANARLKSFISHFTVKGGAEHRTNAQTAAASAACPIH